MMKKIYFLVVYFFFASNIYGAVIIPNSGFEEGTTGWREGHTLGTVSTFTVDGDAFSGSLAAKVTIENPGGYSHISNIPSALVEQTGNYVLSLYAKTSGDPEKIQLAVWKAYDPVTFPTEPVTYTGISSFSSEYQLYQLKDISLSAGEYIRLELGMKNGAVGPSEIWMDNIGVNIVPIPGAIWLLGSGLLGLVGIARRKKTA